MDPTNANTALASAFAEELARAGVRRAVVSPGSRSTPLAVALWRAPELEVTVLVDERSAGFFALGAAQASRAPVALLCTSGTAAANYHPAVCEADESGVPLVVLTADRPPEMRGVGAGQTIDQVKLFGSAVRWFCEVGTHAADDEGLLHYRATACRAVAAARGEPRPGPVHLNLPWREPLSPEQRDGALTATDPLAIGGRPNLPLTTVTTYEAAPSAFLIEEIADHIADAEAGVIVAGRQVDLALRDPLSRLSVAAGFPLLADATSQLRCGYHELSHVVAGYDLLLRNERFASAASPDLVLRFGEMPTSKPLRSWLAGSRADEIVIDPASGWNEPSRRAAAILRADPIELASGWATRLEAIGPAPEPSLWIEFEQAAQAAIDEALKVPSGPPAGPAHGDSAGHPSEPALHRALGRAHRHGDLVYTASSMPIRDLETYMQVDHRDLLFLSNRGANGIDGLLSSGIGAAAASGRPTTILIGDVGMLHDIGGLAALRQVSTPVRIVVINNGGGGIFHFLPQAKSLGDGEFEALLGTPNDLRLVGIATAFGIRHHLLGDLAELEGLLAERTVLIEVPTGRASNVAAHRHVLDAVHAAIDELPIPESPRA